MNSYCVKCKRKTPTVSGVKVVNTKNGKYQGRGTCSVCHKKKCWFVSDSVGKGLLGKVFGLPGGKVPGLGDIPILGALF